MIQIGSLIFQIDQTTAVALGAGLGAAYVALRFLFSWSAKHLLDAKALPVIKDKWSKRNRGKAEKRAGFVLGDYLRQRAAIESPQLMILRVQEHQAGIVSANVTGLGFVITFLLLLLSIVDARSVNLLAPMMLVVGVLLFIMQVGSAARHHEAERSAIMQPKKHREEVIARMRYILDTKIFKPAEVDAWLAKVPQLPVAEHIKPGPSSPGAKVSAPSTPRTTSGSAAKPPEKPEKSVTVSVSDPVLGATSPPFNPLASLTRKTVDAGRHDGLSYNELLSIGATQVNPLLGQANRLLNPVAPKKKE